MVITTQNINQKPGYKRTDVGMIPEDWEVRTLRQLGELKNGINKGKTDFGHGFPFVNLLDVFGVIKVANDSGFGLVNSTDSERKVYSLKKGDVLFVRSSVKPEGVGLTTLVAEDLRDTVYSGFLIRFRDKGELAFEFKEHCFGHFGFRNRLTANSTISANTNINQNALKNLQIAFPPSKEEQRAIATALSDVDALITSLDRLITKKHDIKQATMQQLLTGKTRLPGFSAEWKVKNVEEIAPLQRGFDLPTSQLKKGIHPVVYSNGVLNHHSSFKVKAPGVVTGRSGTIGKVHYIEEDYWPHNTSLWVTDFKGNFPKFIYYMYINIKLERFGTGSGVPTMNRNDVHAYQISIPSFLEQQAISTVLSDMDAEIVALEQKRDKTRALKQGMMQELLTGKTRLV